MYTTKQRQTVGAKTGSVEAAAARYGLGVHSIRKVAEEAGAIVKIGRRVLVNFTVMDAYIDSLSSKE